MLPIFVMILFIWVHLVANNIADQYMDVCRYYKEQNRQADHARITQVVKEAYRAHGTIYADFNDLKTDAGNEHLDGADIDSNIGYAVTGALDDGTWEFQRVVVYAQNPRFGLTDTDFLGADNNRLGTGSFTTAESWQCNDNNSFAWIMDTRQENLKKIIATQKNLKQTITKFVHYYNANGEFPRAKPGGAGDLTDGETITMKELANFAGTAVECAGNYHWEGVPLSSLDLFSLDGNDIVLTYMNANYIRIEVGTGVNTASGDEIVIANFINLN
ncbi:MAG: hypothetical protein GY729_15645 [Desulfobacteraceae bacterium]|nr:hypothetical protein [Desulfobacteraceae bacterium]